MFWFHGPPGVPECDIDLLGHQVGLELGLAELESGVFALVEGLLAVVWHHP